MRGWKKKSVSGDSKYDHDDCTVCRDVFLKVDDHLLERGKRIRFFCMCKFTSWKSWRRGNWIKKVFSESERRVVRLTILVFMCVVKSVSFFMTTKKGNMGFLC